jgi:hypothetical protein
MCPKPFWTLKTGFAEVLGASGWMRSPCTSSQIGLIGVIPSASPALFSTKSIV